ncbi:MAG: hypothetical protein BIFFINMI_02077 [Phycisphaerae bacterium]|nr:hypothetical protein [Phycisphaerae bacterium]
MGEKAGKSTAAQQSDLLRLLEVSRRLAATSDLDELLAMILDHARGILDAERASIFLYDPAAEELFIRLATGVESLRVPIDRGIAGASARTREIVNVPDAYADDRFNPEVDRKTGFRTRSILSVPLIDYEGDLVGVLQVLNKRGRPFDDYDTALAEMLAAQAGVALQRGRLLVAMIEKQRLERELSLARDIQQNLLPSEDPTLAGLAIAGWNQPADETGGDCYDFFALPGDAGALGVLVADATGHGIAPALVVAEARALFRATAVDAAHLGVTMDAVNRILTADLPDDKFVTAFFGIIEPGCGRLTWASGGHGPMLLYRAADDSIVELPATGLPMGIMEDMPIPAADPIDLAPGDQFLIMTDGFTEYPNVAGEQFGDGRVADWIRQTRHLPPREAILDLRDRVQDFANGAPQLDDLTAVLIRKV